VTARSENATRIPRATFASMVGERLRSSILDGTIQPGSQLNEMELASSFGVSRGPVREALQRLIQEGLLRSEPHRGVFVPVMSDADLADIYFAREAMESAAIGRIIEQGRAEAVAKNLDRLVRSMDKAAAAGDWNTVGDHDLDFHAVLVAGAGSPRLDRMFTTVISETRLCLRMLTGAFDARHDLVDEHRRLNQMIRAGKTEDALVVLKKHFTDALSTLGVQAGAADVPEPR
jgi:DNA-binding GntR family transcriptional regulator